MNNPYQNPQYRPPQQDQRYPPPAYQPQTSGPVQHQQGRGSYQQAGQTANNQMSNLSSQHNQGPQNHTHQQIFDKYANSNNQSYAKKGEQQQGIYFPPPQPPVNGLISPPQLQQQLRDSASNAAKTSNIQLSRQNLSDVRDILWGEQQHNNTFWEQKFFMIYQKFEWFGQRFEIIKGQYFTLSEELQTVDSEDDWNELKHHHEQFAERLEEMFQELIAVADQNQQLINQRLGEQGQGVWQRRYHELLSNFKALQQQNNQLEAETENIRLKLSGQDQAQNYPQLLSHYRTLQEEYDKLFNAYNKIQEQNDILLKNPGGNAQNGPSVQDFENMRNEYQRTLQGIQSENEQIKIECQALYEQNEHFRQQMQSHSQLLQQKQHFLNILDEKQSHITVLSRQINQFKLKFEQFQSHQDELLNREKHKNQLLLRQQEKQLQSLKLQLEQKQSQLLLVSNRLRDQNRYKEKLIEEHKEQLSRIVNIQTEKHSRQKSSLQKQLKVLKQEYENLQKQKVQKDTTKYQLESQQNRINYLKAQNQQLNNEIKGKNEELIALRNVSLQLTSYENILEQYKTLEKEKLISEENARKQHSQVLILSKKLKQIQHEFSQHQSLTSSLNSKSVASSQLKQIQQELSAQRQQTSKLSSEVLKFKQLLQSKQSYINQIQQENSKLGTKLQHQLKINDGQRSQHKSQVISLQRKIDTLQKRNRANQVTFKKQITDNYEREIKQLRQSNQQKLKTVKKIEEQLHQIKNKSTHLEKHSSTHYKEHQLLRKKIQSLQNMNTQILKKVEASKSTIHSLEQQISEGRQRQVGLRTQVNSYSVQMQEADSLIKNKNNIIVDYEKQVNQFIEKIYKLQGRIDGEKKQKNEKIKRLEDQIERLKERLYSKEDDSKRQTTGYPGSRYSSVSNNRYMSFGTKQPQSTQHKNQEIFKLQNNIIEQMNQENTRLRNQFLEVTKKLNELQSLSRVVANIQNSKHSTPSKRKINNVPQRDVGSADIEERLMKFNERLQHCIHDNQVFSEKAVDLNTSQRIAYHQRQRRQLQIRYQREIQALKDQTRLLQQKVYTLNTTKQEKKSSRSKPLNDSDIKQFDKYEIMQQQTQKSLHEELEFLRSKLNQQSKTNASLIKLNEQLKKQLEEYLQMNKHSTTEYYKMQWKQSQKSLFEEKQKLKKLSEQNKRLKHQNLQHDTKMVKEYELKLFNIEMKLKEVQRQNSYLNINKTKGDNERANLLHDVNVYSADVEAIKSSMQTRISQYEKVNIQLRNKCTALQSNHQPHTQKFGKQNVSPSPSFRSHDYNTKVMA